MGRNNITGSFDVNGGVQNLMSQDGSASFPIGSVIALADILAKYEASKENNPRVNATIASQNIAFGASPAAGTMGYVNAGISTSGYNFTTVGASIVNAAPDQGNPSKTSTSPVRVYGALPYNYSNSIQQISHFGADGSRQNNATASFVVITDEPKPILYVAGGTTPGVFSLIVNDGSGRKRVVDPTITAFQNSAFVGPNLGGFNPVLLDFTQLGGRKRRTFELPAYQNTSIYRVGITPDSTFFDPPSAAQILFITDSLGSTVQSSTTPAYPTDAYVAVAADYLGVKDCYALTEGGTGYTANGGGGAKTTFAQRIANAMAMRNLRPHVVCYVGGVNDSNDTGPQLQGDVTNAVNAGRNAWPNALHIVFGSWAGATLASQANQMALEPYMKTAVQAFKTPMVQFVPVMTDPFGPWILGDGNTSTQHNNGNADFYFDPIDSTHWNLTGHASIGKRVAESIATCIKVALGYEL